MKYGGSCGAENRSALLKVFNRLEVEWLRALLLIPTRLLLYFNYCRLLFINYKLYFYHLKAVMLPIIKLPTRRIIMARKHFFLSSFPFHLLTLFYSNFTYSSTFTSYSFTLCFCLPFGSFFLLFCFFSIRIPSWCWCCNWDNYYWYISNCLLEFYFCFSNMW